MQCYKITNGIFHRTKTKYSTICMETKKTPNSLSNLRKENELEESGSLTSDYTTKLWLLKQYSTGQKQKCESVEQAISPEINPCTCGYLICDKGGKNT